MNKLLNSSLKNLVGKIDLGFLEPEILRKRVVVITDIAGFIANYLTFRDIVASCAN